MKLRKTFSAVNDAKAVDIGQVNHSCGIMHNICGVRKKTLSGVALRPQIEGCWGKGDDCKKCAGKYLMGLLWRKVLKWPIVERECKEQV